MPILEWKSGGENPRKTVPCISRKNDYTYDWLREIVIDYD